MRKLVLFALLATSASVATAQQNLNSTSGSNSTSTSGSMSGASNSTNNAANNNIGTSNSNSNSNSNSSSGSVSGANSSGNTSSQGQGQMQGQSANNTQGQGQSQGQSANNTQGQGQSQGQDAHNSQSQGQTATNANGQNVSLTFNSKSPDHLQVKTNTPVGLTASSSFSSDYCGATMSGGASAAPLGISLGISGPKYDKSCQALRRAEKFGMAAANAQNMGQPELAQKLMSMMIWSICTADTAGPTLAEPTAQACAQMGLMGPTPMGQGPHAAASPPPAPPAKSTVTQVAAKTVTQKAPATHALQMPVTQTADARTLPH